MSGENGTSPWQPGYCLVKAAVRQTWRTPALPLLLHQEGLQEVFCPPLKIEPAPFPEIPRPRIDGTSSASSSSASKHSGQIFIIHEPTGSREAIKSVADYLMPGPPFIATKLAPAIPAWQPLSPKDWDSFEIFNNALKIREESANYARAHTNQSLERKVELEIISYFDLWQDQVGLRYL